MRKTILLIFFVLISLLTFSSCNYCKLFGDNRLGDKFTLLEGDKTEDRIIVYCTGKSWGCCYTGIPVIPSRTDSVSRYVIDAVSNEKWIIANTIKKDNLVSYWIIDKDFDVEFMYDDGGKLYNKIQSHLTGPMDSTRFYQSLKERKIDLRF